MEKALLNRIQELEDELKKQFNELDLRRKKELKDLKEYYENEMRYF